MLQGLCAGVADDEEGSVPAVGAGTAREAPCLTFCEDAVGVCVCVCCARRGGTLCQKEDATLESVCLLVCLQEVDSDECNQAGRLHRDVSNFFKVIFILFANETQAARQPGACVCCVCV